MPFDPITEERGRVRSPAGKAEPLLPGADPTLGGWGRGAWLPPSSQPGLLAAFVFEKVALMRKADVEGKEGAAGGPHADKLPSAWGCITAPELLTQGQVLVW